jgi:hypothetical protein
VLERRKEELELIRSQYGDIEVDSNLGWFIIKQWNLLPGWNKKETSVLINIPPGYPVTPPDNFYVDNDLRLAGGTQPANTSLNQSHLGKQWLAFSYHVEGADWHPHADVLKGHNILTFLTGVAKRLSEAN